MEHALTSASVQCVDAWVALLELSAKHDGATCGDASIARALRRLEDEAKGGKTMREDAAALGILRRLQTNPEARKWARLGNVACHSRAPEPDDQRGTVAEAPRRLWSAIIATMEADTEVARKWAQDLVTDADLASLVKQRTGDGDFSTLLRISGVAMALMTPHPSEGVRAPGSSAMCSLRSAHGEWKRPSAYARSYGEGAPPPPAVASVLPLALGAVIVALAYILARASGLWQ